MRVPIACSLSEDAATDRIERWRVALATFVTDSTRRAPGRLELRLVEGPDAAGQLVDLSRQEKACCGFFDFTVEIDADGVTLVVEVPDDAVGVLDDFAAVVGS